MAKSTSITLGNHFNRFIAREISTGRFGTASEVVRAGLRLLESEERKMEALRAALDEGERSGIAASYSLEAVLKKLKLPRAR
jgi:antitoxin ParD1/3/4